MAFVFVDPPLVLVRAGTTRQLATTAWLTNGTRLTVTNLTTWSVSFPGGGASIDTHGLLSVTRPGVGAGRRVGGPLDHLRPGAGRSLMLRRSQVTRPAVDFGCEFCANDHNRWFGHVRQIARRS